MLTCVQPAHDQHLCHSVEFHDSVRQLSFRDMHMEGPFLQDPGGRTCMHDGAAATDTRSCGSYGCAHHVSGYQGLLAISFCLYTQFVWPHLSQV